MTDEIRKSVREAGYAGYYWHPDDVRAVSEYGATDEEAFEILEQAFDVATPMMFEVIGDVAYHYFKNKEENDETPAQEHVPKQGEHLAPHSNGDTTKGGLPS